MNRLSLLSGRHFYNLDASRNKKKNKNLTKIKQSKVAKFFLIKIKKFFHHTTLCYHAAQNFHV